MNIEIRKADGTLFREVPITASAKLEQEIMKTDSVTLSWNDVDGDDIPVGCYILCPINGIMYHLIEPYTPKAANVGYTYTPVFVSELMMLSKIPFLLYSTDAEGKTTVESDWNFTGRGVDLVSIIERSISQGIGVNYRVNIDDSIEASLSLSFANSDILSAINSMASAWNCEWYTEEQITNMAGDKVIYFVPKAVHGSKYQLVGGDNVEMPSTNAKGGYCNRFYVFGATRNIPQDYEGAQANHIVNKRLTLNPERYPNGYIDLPLFDDEGNVMTDEDGKVIIDPSIADARVFAKVLIFEDIYPKSNCRVSGIQYTTEYVTDDDGKPVVLADGRYDTYRHYFIQLEYEHVLPNGKTEWLPFTINPKTYTKENPEGQMIKGKTLSLHFSSGALEGREFEATYYENETTKRGDDGASIQVKAGSFGIKHSEDNTIILPNVGIEPKAASSETSHDGDKIIVFNIQMPVQYYDTAYKELEEKAYEQIYADSRDNNEYTIKSNPIAFEESQPNLTLGRLITFSFGDRTIETRVIGLTTALDRTYEQTIKLSKSISKGTINTLLTTIDSTQQKVMDVSVKDDIRAKLNKQQYYTALDEQINAMFDNSGSFDKPINPLRVQTAMLQVGSSVTNFQLQQIQFQPNYFASNEAANYNKFFVQSTDGELVHYGISNEDGSPRVWSMSGGLTSWYEDGSPVATPTSNKYYYLYAVCFTSSNGGGYFILDTKQWKYNDVADRYYFLVGVLSSAMTYGDYTSRVLSVSYGTTTIDGRNIKTGRLQSVDGKTYFDLDSGIIRGNIFFEGQGEDEDVDDFVKRLMGTEMQDAADKAVKDAVGREVEQAVEEAIENLNIEVGGENLLDGTLNMSGQWCYQVNQPDKTSDISSHIVSGLTYKGGNVVKRYESWYGWGKYIDCEPNTPYVMSAYLRRVGSSYPKLYSYAVENGGSYKNLRSHQLTEEWVRISSTYTTSSSAKTLLMMFETDSTQEWQMCLMKIERGNVATDYSQSQNDLQSDINTANTNAATAKSNAETAAEQAAEATSTLADYASDSKIVATEKQGLKQQYNDILNEYASIKTEADKYDVSATAFTTAYNNVKSALEYFCGIASGSPAWATSIDISSGTNKTRYGYISAYYSARQTILNQITNETLDAAAAAELAAQAAKTATDNIKLGGRNYVLNSASALTYNGKNAEREVNVQHAKLLSDSFAKECKQNDYISVSYDWESTTALNSNSRVSVGIGDASPWQFGIADTTKMSGHVEASAQLASSVTTYGGVSVRLDYIPTGTKITIKNIKLERGNKPSAYSLALEDVSSDIATAYNAAVAADEKANNAAKSAQSALSDLDKINDDNYISPSEKKALTQQLKQIQSNKNEDAADASKYSLTSDATYTALQAAETSAINALTKYTSTATEHIAVGSDYANIAAYYPKRQAFLNKVTDAAKTYAQTQATTAVNNIKIGGRNIVSGTTKSGTIKLSSSEKTWISTSVFKITDYGKQTLKANSYVTISFNYTHSITSGRARIRTDIFNQASDGSRGFIGDITSSSASSGHISTTIRVGSVISYTNVVLYAEAGGTGSVTISNLMYEISTKESAWCPAPEDDAADIAAAKQAAAIAQERAELADYLLQATNNGGTYVNGGLVMSNLLLVGDVKKNKTWENITAGINGLGYSESDASSKPLYDASGNPLRIWAGSRGESIEGAANAPFRVYDNGHVEMEDVNINSEDTSGNKLQLGNAAIQIVDKTKNKVLTTISQDRPSSVTESMNGADRQTIVTPTDAVTTAMSRDSVVIVNGKAERTYYNELDLGTITASADNGKLTIPAMSFSIYQYIDSFADVDLEGASSYTQFYLYVGQATAKMVSVASIASSKSASNQKTTTINTTSYSQQSTKGQAYKVHARVVTKVTLSNTKVQSGTSVVPMYANTRITPAASYTIELSYESYLNKLLGNGFVFGYNDSSFMAYINSVANSAETYRFRQGNLIERIVGGKRYWNESGGVSKSWRSNPLVAIVRLTYQKERAVYALSILFNPLNKAMDARRIEKGIVNVTHNLGLSNMCAKTEYGGVGSGSCYSRDIMCEGITTSTKELKIHIMQGDTHYDAQNDGDYIDVFFYDYSSVQ